MTGGREALGRSRGGLTTRTHLVADRRCRPIARITSPGRHADGPKFVALMESVRIHRRGVGRPRKKPAHAFADKTYSSLANRRYLRRRGIKAVIPVRKDQAAHRANRGSKGGRPRSSTGTPTRKATPSNAASISSVSTARWPPATTNARPSTRAPSMSPRSASGSATQSHDHWAILQDDDQRLSGQATMTGDGPIPLPAMIPPTMPVSTGNDCP
ncbi:transposase [Actinomadura geliboluensis]|uniref:transposase n=1 Tax=Actinomadura geliboluensis TaxID=882440 RepID=UPI001486F86A